MRRIFLAAVVVCWSGALGPRAQAAGDESNPTKIPDSIVVTANRFGQTEAKSVWPVAALKPEAIQRDISLQQTLDGRFGLDLRQSTGDGSISTLSNWGTFARHMLLLYNGRPVRDYSLGGFNLSDFSSDEFDRIELVKGPQSAYYGADAIGGVVNLISRTSLVDRAKVTSRLGSNNMRQYRADAAKSLGSVGVGGFAEFGKTDNARSNSGAERNLFGLRSDYLSPDGKHKVAMSARYFEDSLGAPGPVPDPMFVPVYGSEDASYLFDHQNDQNYSVDASYAYHQPAIGDFQLDMFWEKKNLSFTSLYNYESYYNTYDTTEASVDTSLNIDSVDVHALTIYNKRSSGVSGRFQRQVGKVSGSAGVDWLSGSLRTTSSESDSGAHVVGPFSPYEYSYSSYNFWSRGQNQLDVWGASTIQATQAFQWDLSGRLQFVHNRKTQPSYDLGGVWTALQGIRFKAAYGYAFRLPSIADQFADETFVRGTANLKPETSHSLVFSAEGEKPSAAMSGRISVFAQTVNQLIQYEWDGMIYRSVPHNVNRFKSTGVDVAVQAKLPHALELTWGAVLQHARQTVDGGAYADAFYVPELKWRADLDGTISPFLNCNLNANYTSDRSIIMYGGVAKIIPQVYEFGMSISAKLSQYLKLTLTGYDLTNRKRPDQFGFTASDRDYPTPGRRFVLQVQAGVM